MRVAVQNPRFIFHDELNEVHGYAFAFLRRYRPIIYLSSWKQASWKQAWRYSSRLHQLGMNPFNFKFVYSVRALNRLADVLVCFNGNPQREENCPLRDFQGMKVAHVQKYHHHSIEAYSALTDAGVDYLLGTANHGRHCSFFKRYYPSFIDRVIPVPLGFRTKFSKRRAFDTRTAKCLLARPLSTSYLCDPRDLEGCREYYNFYDDHDLSHPWLYELKNNYAQMEHVLELLSEEDLINQDAGEQAPQKLNEYMMFVNDAGLFCAPDARTFEGVAAGAVMLAPKLPCFLDLGFEDGKNCILHRVGDVQDFYDKLHAYLADRQRLMKIASDATVWMHTNFSHDSIAQNLYASLQERFSPVLSTL